MFPSGRTQEMQLSGNRDGRKKLGTSERVIYKNSLPGRKENSSTISYKAFPGKAFKYLFFLLLSVGSLYWEKKRKHFPPFGFPNDFWNRINV